MRILVLCPHVPHPPVHGGRIRTGVMLRALSRGNEVVVVAPVACSERDDADGLRAAYGVEVLELPSTPPVSSPRRKLTSWARGRADVVARLWSSDSVRAAHEIVASAAPDLVVVDGTFAAPLLPPRLGARVVLGLHNVESEVVARLSRGLVSRVESRLLARFEARLARRADLVVAVSARDARLLASLAPEARVAVVENTVDVASTPRLAAPPGGAPVVLFVGSFDYPPNRQAASILVDEHLPVLRRAFPDLRVRLVGRDHTGEIAARAAASPGVEFAGFVDDLRPEYEPASAVYVPLRSGGGTRIKVLEALAFGRPVIATDLAVEGLDLERGAHYLPCDTAEHGAASLGRVLAGEAAELVERGRALVENRYDHAVAEARWMELVGSVA